MDFDPQVLRAYLQRHLPGVRGDIRLERIGDGQSNPTFFVTFGNRWLVLRKQPGGGNLLPSAHAVDREYRIMGALAATPFYVMERVEGRVFGQSSLPASAPPTAVPWCWRWARRSQAAPGGLAGHGPRGLRPDGQLLRAPGRAPHEAAADVASPGQRGYRFPHGVAGEPLARKRRDADRSR